MRIIIKRDEISGQIPKIQLTIESTRSDTWSQHKWDYRLSRRIAGHVDESNDKGLFTEQGQVCFNRFNTCVRVNFNYFDFYSSVNTAKEIMNEIKKRVAMIEKAFKVAYSQINETEIWDIDGEVDEEID